MLTHMAFHSGGHVGLCSLMWPFTAEVMWACAPKCSLMWPFTVLITALSQTCVHHSFVIRNVCQFSWVVIPQLTAARWVQNIYLTIKVKVLQVSAMNPESPPWHESCQGPCTGMTRPAPDPSGQHQTQIRQCHQRGLLRVMSGRGQGKQHQKQNHGENHRWEASN